MHWSLRLSLSDQVPGIPSSEINQKGLRGTATSPQLLESQGLALEALVAV